MPTEKQYYDSALQYFSNNWFEEVTDLPQDVQPILSQVIHYRKNKDEHIFYAFRGNLKMGNKNLLNTTKPTYFNQNNVTEFVQILRKLQQKKKLNGKEGCDLFIAIVTKKKLIVQFRPGLIIQYKNKGKTCNRFKYEYLSYRSAVLFFDTSIVQLTHTAMSCCYEANFCDTGETNASQFTAILHNYFKAYPKLFPAIYDYYEQLMLHPALTWLGSDSRFPDILDFHTLTISMPFTYQEMIKANNLTDLLQKHYQKRQVKLPYNPKKLTLKENIYLRRLFQMLTPTAFAKMYNWYMQMRKQNPEELNKFLVPCYTKQFDYTYYSCNSLFIYTAYKYSQLKNKQTINLSEFAQKIHDYYLNFKILHPNKKFAIPYTSAKKIYSEENKIANDANSKRTFKHYGVKPNDKLNTSNKWSKMHQKVNLLQQKHYDVKVVDTPQKLLQEGQKQHNCIATYIDKVINDKSAILHYNDAQKIPYSFELIPEQYGNYYLNQIYGDYDRDCPTDIEEQVKKWFE